MPEKAEKGEKSRCYSNKSRSSEEVAGNKRVKGKNYIPTKKRGSDLGKSK